MTDSTIALVHLSCGGNVALDVGSSVKMLAPSFGIGTDGISTILLELVSAPDGEIQPQWYCSKCRDTVPYEQLGDRVRADCQVCGKLFPCSEIYVHRHIPYVCASCKDGMQFHKKKSCSDIQLRNAQLYNIGERSEFIPLVDILTRKFKI